MLQHDESEEDDAFNSTRSNDQSSSKKEKKKFALNIIENFQLNIATSSFVKIEKDSLP